MTHNWFLTPFSYAHVHQISKLSTKLTSFFFFFFFFLKFSKKCHYQTLFFAQLYLNDFLNYIFINKQLRANLSDHFASCFDKSSVQTFSLCSNIHKKSAKCAIENLLSVYIISIKSNSSYAIIIAS